jgi:diketogulonate reductase-like aldo/keto reductase
VLVRARDEGLIGGIGISNVTRGHLQRALEVTEIVCVQNFFNLADRNSLPIVNECTVRNIAFVSFCALGFPQTQREAILTNPAVAGAAGR